MIQFVNFKNPDQVFKFDEKQGKNQKVFIKHIICFFLSYPFTDGDFICFEILSRPRPHSTVVFKEDDGQANGDSDPPAPN